LSATVRGALPDKQRAALGIVDIATSKAAGVALDILGLPYHRLRQPVIGRVRLRQTAGSTWS